MKVLLTHAYFINEDQREQEIMKPYPPLGLLYISAYLEKMSVEHKVFDSTFSNFEDQMEFISDYQADVIGIYCNLMTKVKVVQLMRTIGQISPKTKIVVGGPDVRYNTAQYINSGADFAVIGEGEVTFYELLKSLNKSKDELKLVEGIAFLENDAIHHTADRALMKHMDELPFPAFKNINTSKYLDSWKKNHGMSMLSVSTQRGCPYTCKWCSTAVYGQSYRRKSPKKVVEELLSLQKSFNPDAIWFVDDVFTVSHKWLSEFNKELKSSGVKIPFECITRADRMNKEVIQTLKEAGCFRVWIGAESGSQKILDAMDRRVKAEEVQEMIQESKKAEIEAGTFIMLGYPGEKLSDIDSTIQHLVKSDPDQFTITLAYPIKGTELFNEIEEIQIGDIDWTTQTDRERDFKRSFSRSFYDHAIRNVVNEVKYKQLRSRKEGSVKRQYSHYLKARVSRLMMHITK